MLRFLRLRYLLLYAILFGIYNYVDWRWLLQSPVTYQINAVFHSAGYPDPAYDISELTLSHLVIDHLRLEPDAINTVEKIDVRYSPWSLLRGRVRDITVEKPDLIFSADALPFQTHDKSSSIKAPSFSLRALPFDNLTIKDLSISYAGDNISPGVTGDVTLATASNGQKTILFAFAGAQKDFNLTLKGSISETTSGVMNIKMDIPEARMDMQGFMMSRAHGQFEIDYAPDAPISANGEWVAGAMRVGTIPLDNVSIVASGHKPDFSVIGNAGITGVSMTNVSLRLAEDANGAQLLLQISGGSPQKLAAMMAAGANIPLPENQKFVATYDMKDKTLQDLFASPYKGGLFLYDDAATPFLSVAVDCPGLITDCILELPESTLNVAQINRFAAPALADQGLELFGGTINLSGTLSPFTGAAVMPLKLDAKFKQLDADWQNLKIRKASGSVMHETTGAVHMRNLQAGVFGGTVTSDKIDLDAHKNGQLTLNLKNLDMNDLAHFMQIKGIDISGRASGRLPVTIKGGAITITKGGMINGLKGNLKYKPQTYPGFLAGDDNRMAVLRGALEDYTFDSLQLDFSGDPMGTLSASLAAKGRNQALFGERPIHINLKIDGPLAPAVKQLLPYFGSTNSPEDQ